MKTKRITQYLHYLNATELGKSGTHETYLSISKDVDLSNIFPLGVDVAVEDIKSRKIYQLKSSDGNGNEFRVNKMGELYRDYSMMPGDLIVITHFDELNSKRTTISAITFNGVVLSVDSKGGELNNVERLSPFLSGEKQYSLEAVFNGNLSKLIITFVEAKKKRADSPIDTDYYEISVDGQKLANGKYYLIIGKENVLHVAKKYEYNTVFLEEPDELGKTHIQPGIKLSLQQPDNEAYTSLLTALRTKPFVLLAGISGTGKSRIVRELAFKSCPAELQDTDNTTPGNYCMIEVKPNWHDSTELLGYYSNIGKRYVFTEFVKFLVKAMQHPEVPFFVCLDEMNLAPVEQYFAEFLSVLETRKIVGYHVVTGALVKSEWFTRKYEGGFDPFAEVGLKKVAKTVSPNETELFALHTEVSNEPYERQDIVDYLKEKGITLPDNVFVIGTVNMDDTTHQFSRKVIDRAMTIEMNGGDLNAMFGGSAALNYLPEDKRWKIEFFRPRYVNADEVLAAHPDCAEQIKAESVEKIKSINTMLENTPFVVSYRVLNELVIYLGNLLDAAQYQGDGTDEIFVAKVQETFDAITLMKILPRVEGDDELFDMKNDTQNRLQKMQELFTAENSGSHRKLQEMDNRLEQMQFTRFWP